MLDSIINNPVLTIINLSILVIVISIHEYAHAKAADYLGDPTARLAGRLTLKPTSHIDLYGMFFLIVAGFGWGKPVPFDPFNLKNPRRDAALISLAGPASNFAMAVLAAIIMKFIGANILLEIFLQINLLLGVFNLIPVHPLDGFKIVGGILSEEKAHEWYALERYGMIFLILLIIPFSGKSMVSTIISPIIEFFYRVLTA